MKRLFGYIKPLTAMISLGLSIKFIGAMMDLVIPSILAKIIDEYASQKMEGQVYLWGGVMIVCALICLAANIIANRYAAISSGKITEKLRHDLFSKVFALSASQTDKFTVPSLISRLTSDTYNVNQMLARTQRMGVRAPILLIGGIIITMTLDPVLTLVLLGTLPFIVLTVYFVTKFSVSLYTKVQEALDRLTRTVQENFTGVRVIKALSKTEYEKAKFDGHNTELTAKERRVGIIMSLTNPTTTIILNIGLTAIILVGAFRVDSGLTTPGKIIAFQSYFTIILNAMLGISRVFIMFTKGTASANRISEVLDEPDDMPIAEETPEQSEFHIEFRDVTFSYNKKEPNLSHVSFALKHGDTLGIIGATGSGKTTVINLLNRFYDPDEGTILINGRDIRSIPNDEFRKKFGNALQRDFIVAADLAENISFYRDIPAETLCSAAENASASEFIENYPDKYNHSVSSRGNDLSGGQKQRILIARALAGNPEILVLDDASSALDYKTDAELRKALHENYTSSTKIIVAQRVASIRHADLILVLEDGEVIGQGTHTELIRTCETYRLITETQMGESEVRGNE